MKHSLRFMVMIAITVYGLTAHAGGTLYILDKAPYHKDADIRPAIRKECGLEQKLPQFVKEYAKKSGFDKVELVSSTRGRQGVVLRMVINTAHAAAGGTWTGAKSVTASGTLRQGKKTLGTFTVRRSSAKAYRGTCSLLGRNTKVMGRDISQWLEKPSKGSRLGELARR